MCITCWADINHFSPFICHKFQVYRPHYEDFQLHIKYVRPKDAGFYECQVSTEPVSAYHIHLNVVGEDFQTWHIYTKILQLRFGHDMFTQILGSSFWTRHIYTKVLQLCFWTWHVYTKISQLRFGHDMFTQIFRRCVFDMKCLHKDFPIVFLDITCLHKGLGNGFLDKKHLHIELPILKRPI